MATSIASLFSGVKGIDDSTLNAFKTPEQVREEQLSKLRERSSAQATLLSRLGQRGTTALPGIIGSFAASQLPEQAVDLNQAARRGMLGLGQIAGATGRTGVQEALQQSAVSPAELEAQKLQSALKGINFNNVESMESAYNRLANQGANPALLERLSNRITQEKIRLFEQDVTERELALQEGQQGQMKVPTTETRIEGDDKVTYQWNGVTGKWDELSRGPRYKPGTEVNINQGSGAFDQQLGKDMSSALTEANKSVQTANKSLQNLDLMENLLDEGVITGTFANSRTAFERALASAGLIDGQRVTNTETFLATGAQQTLALLQTGAAGAGTGISDADREFMEKAAGGNITVTEDAIRRIIRINRQIAQNVYGTYNQTVKDIKQTFPDSESAKRLSEKYYPGQRAKTKDGTIIIYDPTQGWVEQQ